MWFSTTHIMRRKEKMKNSPGSIAYRFYSGIYDMYRLYYRWDQTSPTMFCWWSRGRRQRALRCLVNIRMLHSEHNLFISFYNRTHTYAHINRTMSDKKPERERFGERWDTRTLNENKWQKRQRCEARTDHQTNVGMEKKVSFSFFSKCDNDDLNECDIKWWCGADFNQTTKKRRVKDPKGSRIQSFQCQRTTSTDECS